MCADDLPKGAPLLILRGCVLAAPLMCCSSPLMSMIFAYF
jgi:hypothetical protein